MKTKSIKMLPKTTDEITNGGLYIQAVRCGKSNCKCSRGTPHTGFYFFTRRSGKLVKIYVRRADVEAFTSLVTRSNIERRIKRQANKTSADLLRKFRADLLVNNNAIQFLREGVMTNECQI